MPDYHEDPSQLLKLYGIKVVGEVTASHDEA
jgi:hypothetical protein